MLVKEIRLFINGMHPNDQVIFEDNKLVYTGRSYAEKKRPEFLQPCTEQGFPGIDADDIMDNATCDLFEDAIDHLQCKDKFRQAVKEFNEAQSLKTWNADHKRKIKLVVGRPIETAGGEK